MQLMVFKKLLRTLACRQQHLSRSTREKLTSTSGILISKQHVNHTTWLRVVWAEVSYSWYTQSQGRFAAVRAVTP